MNNRIRKALAASLLALALASSAFAGVIHTGNAGEPSPCDETQTCASGESIAPDDDMEMDSADDMRIGATDLNEAWLIVLSLLDSLAF